MTAVSFELDCNRCGGVFYADRSTLGANDYLIRNGQVVEHTCPQCAKRKEPTMTTDTTTLTDDLHEALTAEAEAWGACEEAKLACLTDEATIEQEIREEARREGERITEAVIAARVSMTERAQVARRLVIKTELRYRLMKADVAQAQAVVSLHKAECYRQAGRVA